MKPKLLVIVGPTASGKSDLAVYFAKQYNGEIISADSRQVYRGLDIGSGKITETEMQGIPHHLIDVADPMESFSVDDFKRLAQTAIADIHARHKLPIIVGGTGFYIDTVVYNLSLPHVPKNDTLRKQLETNTTTELVHTLQQLDPKSAATIDVHNRVRLIRAIEIAQTLGQVPPQTKEHPYNTLWIGISWPDDVLKERITKRLDARFAQGMIEEVANLHASGVSWERLHELGLEYRYIAQYLQNMCTEEALRETLLTRIWQYAKRQKTWLKQNREIHWYTPDALLQQHNIVDEFLTSQY